MSICERVFRSTCDVRCYVRIGCGIPMSINRSVQITIMLFVAYSYVSFFDKWNIFVLTILG